MAEKEFRHIVRFLGTDIKGERTLLYGLRKIKGVGFMFANAICRLSKVNPQKKVGELEDQEIKRIEASFENPSLPSWLLNRRKDYETGEDKHLFQADLDFTRANDKKRLMKIKSYRGLRLQWGLPVRGQKTKSNFRKNKGKTMGVKRKGKQPAKKSTAQKPASSKKK